MHREYFWILVSVLACNLLINYQGTSAQTNLQTTWPSGWQIAPTASWLVHTRIPMTSASFLDYEDDDEAGRSKGGKNKNKKNKNKNKKFKKFMMPLLIAYKLKFFTLIPILIGGLLLLTGATGLAGFFFALFAASMGLSKTQ